MVMNMESQLVMLTAERNELSMVYCFLVLVDAGAQSTNITKSVAELVNLTPIGKVPVQSVSGRFKLSDSFAL